MTKHLTRCVAAVAICFCGLFLGAGTGCISRLAAPAALSERGYRVALRVADPVMWLNAPNPLRFPPTAEVALHVRNEQGQPVDGVTVLFTVESSWLPYASFTPAEGLTRHGEVRAVMQASTTGVIPIIVRVDNLTLRDTITVASPPNFGGGGS